MKKSLNIFIIIVVVVIFVLCSIIAGCDDEEHVHSYVNFLTYKDSTCTEDGEMRMYCECEDYISQPILATGHNYGSWS